jgi:phage/plasmid-like protein (TIGR03299 family)
MGYSGMYDDDTAFFSGKRESWHGLTATEIVDDVKTAKEAIEISGLGWNVYSTPVFATVGDEQVEIPGKKALVREDTGKVLSVMGNSYEIVQNAEAFSFVDEILGGPDVRFHAAGSLHDGARIWLSAKMDREIYIGGDVDEKIDPYVMFANSHDGSLAVSCWITPIRIACQNALTYSMRTAKRSWKARHTKNVMGKTIDARSMLGIASRYFDDLEEIGNRLIETKVSGWQMNKMVEALLPMPEGKRVDEVEDGRAKTLTMNRREKVWECIRAEDLGNISGTAWGFVQAVADWDDHYRTAKNEDVRLSRVMFGDSTYKERSLTIAKEVAPV